MTYLLILFVLALALAPLSHFVPSKRQRKIARLREYAAVNGLFVEYRSAPGGAEGRGRGPGSSPGDIIYYGKRLAARRGAPVQKGSWIFDREGGWRSLKRPGAVPPLLLELPAEVIAASVDEGSCGIYWRESLGEDGVEQIRRVLEGWSGVLLS